MSLKTDTLAVLARKNLAVGPVPTTYTISPAFPSALPTAEGDGVNVADAIWALVTVRAEGGNAVFSLYKRGIDSEPFDLINGGSQIEVAEDEQWSDEVRVATLAELAVVVLSGSATSVEVEIAPCLG